MENAKSKIKLGIYGIGLLMMGVIGISSSLSTIGAKFPEASQTMIQNLISIPCIVIIPTTIVVGKLMQTISKKNIALAGIIIFLIGGAAPAFMTSFTTILIMRGILGVGIGICQVVSTAIVAENFSGVEQQKVQGTLQASQMAGAAIMVFAGGWLTEVRWNYVFYVHLLAIISLILVAVMVPNTKPEKMTTTGDVQKTKLTSATWGWVIFMFILFISVQVYSISLSFLVTEKNLGTAADSGLGLAFFAIGGIIMGLLYGSLAKRTKNCAIAVGCLMLAVAYVVIAFANSMIVCHIGSILVGMAVSAALPGIFINTGMSVDVFSAGMAISVVTCAQNFGQFCCPYIINPIAASISGGRSVNFMCFIIGAVVAAALTILMLAWGVKKNRQVI
ncbi:MFS transporter [Clostridium autoethanogenum]|uniref:MFS transporter n=1 Tax=Clostridium autoethanogenum DSM 10061 TaxID=1341692 RepID=A0ABN4BC90_9CLOT|nr:MFS transporter [Clostridium autoethanogenum]AGY75305.1 MFS transporter [Clostridium autoethanogenum DSM 10061]ALU35471.1 MFS transporter [Clostridium autoethanogenum DSM 10061]OVY48570.1 putative transporter [Clostridium autoethanogenum]